jgi:hypothetical protein
VAVTSFHDIREDQYTAIVGITPTSLSSVKFRAMEEDVDDPRDWFATSPQAGLRVFAIVPVDEQTDGPVLDTVRTQVTAEILVGYPVDGKYGTPKRRMREKVMREDHKAIEAVAGILGYSSIGPDATVIGPAAPFVTERVSDKMLLLVFPYTVAFSKDA